MELEAIIGLEIHVQLKTKSKMFCRCANVGGEAEANSAICPICLGYPGTLPVPNGQAITWTQKAGAALGCHLAHTSKFDRKSYFYPDLPKGYQISQYDQPFCGKGQLTVTVAGQEVTVGITRIHLEEDAAKNTHSAGGTLIDYNRAGTPLMEIVTEPDMREPAEAKVFLQELQRIMRALGIADADMEKGQLRADANISLRPKGEDKLYPKTEVKNINSFRFVEKALQYEIARQTNMWEAGEIPQHATRGWDMDNGTTVEQRTKEEAADYRYFPEPDIPPFSFTEEELKAITNSLPELPLQRTARLQGQYNISAEQADVLVNNSQLLNFFEGTVSELEQMDKERVAINSKEIPELVKIAFNVIRRELVALESYDKISPENFAELVVLLQQGKISRASVPAILAEMQATGGDPDPIIQRLGLQQVNEAGELEAAAALVIQENPEVVEKIKAGKEAALQFLMGQVMAKTGGKANPKVIIDLLRKAILG
jgi:aspartyl-tRNA(Asn)/glutamyl-tRNA(Gln) amidotransferase subunit B